MQHVDLFLLAVLGLIVGSFLGLLALRVPRGEPVVVARSACPHCGHRLTAIELLPVASWIVQRRRCTVCGTRLSAFYPVVELAAAAIAVAAGLTLDGLWVVGGCAAGWMLLALAAWAWCRFHSGARL
jgi:leader peptidase (prepilin peptidase) / N-methyltransferase